MGPRLQGISPRSPIVFSDLMRLTRSFQFFPIPALDSNLDAFLSCEIHRQPFRKSYM